MKTLLAAILAILLLTSTEGAADITFAWDSVPNAAGYRLYKSTTTGTYDSTGKVCETIDTTCKVSNVSDGITYFTAVAFDKEKLDGPNSNIVCVQVKSAWIPSVRSCTAGSPVLRIKEASVTYAPTN